MPADTLRLSGDDFSAECFQKKLRRVNYRSSERLRASQKLACLLSRAQRMTARLRKTIGNDNGLVFHSILMSSIWKQWDWRNNEARTSTIDWENEKEKKVSIMTRVYGDRLKLYLIAHGRSGMTSHTLVRASQVAWRRESSDENRLEVVERIFLGAIREFISGPPSSRTRHASLAHATLTLSSFESNFIHHLREKGVLDVRRQSECRWIVWARGELCAGARRRKIFRWAMKRLGKESFASSCFRSHFDSKSRETASEWKVSKNFSRPSSDCDWDFRYSWCLCWRAAAIFGCNSIHCVKRDKKTSVGSVKISSQWAVKANFVNSSSFWVNLGSVL